MEKKTFKLIYHFNEPIIQLRYQFVVFNKRKKETKTLPSIVLINSNQLYL